MPINTVSFAQRKIIGIVQTILLKEKQKHEQVKKKKKKWSELSK